MMTREGGRRGRERCSIPGSDRGPPHHLTSRALALPCVTHTFPWERVPVAGRQPHQQKRPMQASTAKVTKAKSTKVGRTTLSTNQAHGPMRRIVTACARPARSLWKLVTNSIDFADASGLARYPRGTTPKLPMLDLDGREPASAQPRAVEGAEKVIVPTLPFRWVTQPVLGAACWSLTIVYFAAQPIVAAVWEPPYSFSTKRPR
jgi:hypothetical protein